MLSLALVFAVSSAASEDKRLICDTSKNGELLSETSSWRGGESVYQGCQTKTVSGRTCMHWSAQEPHSHKSTFYSWTTMAAPNHNYCRGYDLESEIWCFTMDEKVRWERCKPLSKSEAEANRNKGKVQKVEKKPEVEVDQVEKKVEVETAEVVVVGEEQGEVKNKVDEVRVKVQKQEPIEQAFWNSVLNQKPPTKGEEHVSTDSTPKLSHPHQLPSERPEVDDVITVTPEGVQEVAPAEVEVEEVSVKTAEEGEVEEEQKSKNEEVKNSQTVKVQKQEPIEQTFWDLVLNRKPPTKGEEQNISTQSTPTKVQKLLNELPSETPEVHDVITVTPEVGEKQEPVKVEEVEKKVEEAKKPEVVWLEEEEEEAHGGDDLVEEVAADDLPGVAHKDDVTEIFIPELVQQPTGVSRGSIRKSAAPNSNGENSNVEKNSNGAQALGLCALFYFMLA